MARCIFFVLGMHRTGTSYLTQVLNLMGLELPISIQPGAVNNPQGHYESFDFSRIHDDLLKNLGMTWDTFLSPPSGWFSSESGLSAFERIGENFSRSFPGHGSVILKDPRLSLFLPLWIKYAKEEKLESFFIIPLRHPLEVAASLHNLNNIGASRSILIWLNYMFNAEKNSRGTKRVFINFPEWTDKLDHTINRIEVDLKTSFPKKYLKNMLKAKKELEANFLHYQYEECKDKNNYIEEFCSEVYALFLKLVEDASNSETLSNLDALREHFDKIVSVYSEGTLEVEIKSDNELEQQLIVKKSESDQSASDIHELEKRLKESQARVDTLIEQLHVKESESDQSVNQILELEQRLREQEVLKLGVQDEVSELKALNSAMNKEYEQLVLEVNKQKLTVITPIYRNIYKTTGFLLRQVLPVELVESLKKIIPNPDGVPKRLTYKPNVSKQHIVTSELSSTVTPNSSPDIFILSIINWDFRYQRPQHIGKGLADAGYRVFYVEMELADKEIELEAISNNLFRARLSGRNLGHIQAYTGQPDKEQMERWVAAFYQLCEAVGSTAFKQIIIHHPFWWQLAKHLPPEFRVTFDCMDDMSGFSNTEQFLLNLEHDLLAKCDNLVVSSQYLFDKHKHYQAPTLIRNGAEYNHFNKSTKEIKAPSFLKQNLSKKGSKRIKVGYVGAIAEWFDSYIVREVAQIEPIFEFHLCGAVTANEPAQLDRLENVHLYGEIPYSDVPGFLFQMDVLIIPFKIVPIIQACDPVKFYEYSAIGKPTVTTHLPELSRAGELAFFAETPLEFVAQIHNAYMKGRTNNFRRRLQQYAAKNTWRHRIKHFEKTLLEMPKVSVIILSYGDPELAKSSLHSLYDGGRSYPNLEVIVVDNGSPKNAVREIKEFASSFAEVSIIENGKNLGFAKGNNVGLKAATGEYVMLLNNDTVVAPGAIHAMAQHLARNPAIGVVGPLTNNIGNEAKLFVEYESMTQMKDVARQATTGYRGVFTGIKVVAYFAAMFRKRDLEKFGLLPEEYGLGMFEDDDHCAQINAKGFVCALAEDAYVHHHLSATFSKLEDGQKEILFVSNKKIFEEKWGAWQAHTYRNKRPGSTLK